MKTLRLSLLLLMKHISMHILLVLQMIVVFLISASLISELQMIFSLKDRLAPLQKENCMFFQGVCSRDLIMMDSESSSYAPFSPQEVKPYLVGDPHFFREAQFSACGKNEVEIIGSCFSEAFLNRISFRLKAGTPFSETRSGKHIIRIITDSDKYKVGDTLSANLRTQNDNGKDVEVSFRVIAIAQKPFYVPTTSSGGTHPDVTTLFNEVQKSEQRFINALACQEDLEAIGKEYFSPIRTDNYYVFFDKNTSETEMLKNITVLQKYGLVTSAEEIKNNTDLVVSSELQFILPRVLFMSAIALIGFCGTCLINVSTNLRRLAIYSFLGCSRVRMYRLLFCYCAILEGIAVLPTVFVLLLAQFTTAFAGYYPFVSLDVFFTILGLLIIFMLLNFGFVFFVFSNMSSRRIITET